MSEKIVVTILGIAQDGGVPHPGCLCDTCKRFSEEGRQLSPTSLAVRDGDELHLIDVTRDLDRQTRMLDGSARMITDVWLTHGHLGHVDGLGLFGREVMASRGIRLHASESMFKLIHETPLWNALLDQRVFTKKKFDSGHEIQVSKNLSLVPIKVPHRDEWSDTHAFLLRGPNRALLHLPDHDHWADTLEQVGYDSIREWISAIKADIILMDGTFWSSDDLPRQNSIPHPPILESISRLGPREEDDPDIRFIHLNHSNRALGQIGVGEELMGWSIASEGDEIVL